MSGASKKPRITWSGWMLRGFNHWQAERYMRTGVAQGIILNCSIWTPSRDRDDRALHARVSGRFGANEKLVEESFDYTDKDEARGWCERKALEMLAAMSQAAED